jgi:NYN domain
MGLNIYWQALGSYRKVFYYDALPTKRPNQSDEDFKSELVQVEKLHAKLARLDRFRVNEGDARYRKKRGLEQKKVDVMIAVDMLIHTIRRNMTEATLLAGDADFSPLLTALSNEGMFVKLIHPPAASHDLLSAADARECLSISQLFQWLEPQSKRIIGEFPEIFISTDRSGNYSDLILKLEEQNIELWFEKNEKYYRVSWPVEDYVHPDHYYVARCLDWRNLRLVIEDDHKIILSENLPAEFSHLWQSTPA